MDVDSSVTHSKLGAPTPGPWKWYWHKEAGAANCGIYAEPREGHAVSICRAPQYETKKQWEANARLIAGAPDMLDAIRYYATIDGPVGVMAKGVLAKIGTARSYEAQDE